MRRVRVSRTFFDQLHTLLEQGYPRFGERIVLEKRERVFHLIENHLAHYPRVPRDSQHGLCVYPVRRTPFVVVYDYDEEEVRVMFLFHERDHYANLDARAVEW